MPCGHLVAHCGSSVGFFSSLVEPPVFIVGFKYVYAFVFPTVFVLDREQVCEVLD